MRDTLRMKSVWMHGFPLALGMWIAPLATAQQPAGRPPEIMSQAPEATVAAPQGARLPPLLGQSIPQQRQRPAASVLSPTPASDGVRRLPPVHGPVTPPATQRVSAVRNLADAQQNVQQVTASQPTYAGGNPGQPVVRRAVPETNWGAPPAAVGPYPQPAPLNQVPAPNSSVDIRRTQASQDSSRSPTLNPSRQPLDRLKIPQGLPGADAPPIQLPPFRPDNQLEYSEIIDRIFPRLPGPPRPAAPSPGPGGQKMTYLDLLEIARMNSPLIRQARADIVAARGVAIDVGAYPNPQIGFEMDTIGRYEPNQYVGGLVNQTVVTAGKLRLNRSQALQDVRNAELEFRAIDIDVATAVLAQYYAVLVSQEAVKATNALVQFADETYRVLVEQTKGGEAAAYEPLQLRVLATQARAAAVQAHNRYISAWQQLTAEMAVPQMPPTELAGSIDASPPNVCWDLAVERTVRFHTDVLVAQSTIAREQFDVRRQRVEPIPDIHTYVAIQKDNNDVKPGVSMNLQTYINLPIFYRNQGGILRAQGELTRATQEVQQTQNVLIKRLAIVFERYENARKILLMYRDQILPDQARAYRGVFERHQQQPQTIAFGDVVVAQQILATTITQYITVLNEQWTALADLENVTQTLDLTQLVEEIEAVPVPPPAGNAPAGVLPPNGAPQQQAPQQGALQQQPTSPGAPKPSPPPGPQAPRPLPG